MNNQSIIDIHAHIYPEKIAARAVEAVGEFYGIIMDSKGTTEQLLEYGSRIGAAHYAVHSVATTDHQVFSVNEFIAGEMKAHPELTGFATLLPFMDDLEKAVEEAKRLGLKGIKLHPDFQRFYIDDPRCDRMYELIRGFGPVLFHMGDETRDYSRPERLARVLDKFPDMVVIAAHMGGYSTWDESRKYLLGRDIYLDTSSTLFKLPKEDVTDMILSHGVERVLFGTDYPMWKHDEELARFMALDLTDRQRRRILYDNAAGLLGLNEADGCSRTFSAEILKEKISV
ncbi:MAG: amidohydrolase family protein [Christensenellales bacterium]|jgi:predicted TIM-barrel fold metal-dependent hydrolase